MKKITIKIKDLFDAIEQLEKTKFDYDTEIIQHNKILIKNESGDYVDVVSLIKKKDFHRKINFDNGTELTAGKSHKLSYDGYNCAFLSDLSIGDRILDSAGETLIITNIDDIDDVERDVYDIEVDNETHLYQTKNKLIHHNTSAAIEAANVLNRSDKFFRFNLGSMQDARSSLIGNTHFEKETGTIFSESAFVKAIQTENSIILLDELSRASHDAINILMTILDNLQRYLRLDEKKTSDVINVAKGVTFIATANIGSEYTATRVMDRALLNRFSVKIEMNPISKEEELKLMYLKFNNFDNDADKLKLIEQIVEIAEHTRKEVNKDDSKLTDFISTRAVVEMAELIMDGFSLLEICECVVYPIFSIDGGVDSERTYIKQLVQKYIPAKDTPDAIF